MYMSRFEGIPIHQILLHRHYNQVDFSSRGRYAVDEPMAQSNAR